MLLPSSLIKVVHAEYPREFVRRFGADSERLRSFWTDFLRRPRTRLWASRHPCLAGKAAADLVTSVPITLHEDSGPCGKNSSGAIISWSCLLSEGPEKLTQFIICSWL